MTLKGIARVFAGRNDTLGGECDWNKARAPTISSDSPNVGSVFKTLQLDKASIQTFPSV